MRMKHVLLEVYCESNTSDSPSYCINGIDHPGYHCLSENCPNVSFTYAPHELAYSGEFGVVPDSKAWIGFGGEMLPEDANEQQEVELKAVWESICRRKMEEAYIEYMEQIHKHE